MVSGCDVLEQLIYGVVNGGRYSIRGYYKLNGIIACTIAKVDKRRIRRECSRCQL